MIVKISKEMGEAMGWENLEVFGLNENSIRYMKKTMDLELAEFTLKAAMQLSELAQKHLKVRGMKPLLRDIDIWLSIIGDNAKMPKNMEQFGTMLKEYMRKVEGHRLYRKNEDGQWLAYLVNGVVYTPPQRHDGYTTPASVKMELLYQEFGHFHRDSIYFGSDHGDSCEQTVLQALHSKELFPETKELRAEYLKDQKLSHDMVGALGKQYTAVGTALSAGESKQRYSWSSPTKYKMEKDGKPTNVVIDIIKEGDEDSKTGKGADLSFWGKIDYHSDKIHANGKDRDEDDIEEDDEVEETAADKTPEAPEVPEHPMVVVFDLKRHMRFEIHAAFLTEYKYDKSLGSKLVLPADVHDLVEMLFNHRGAFKDIISGKGSGAIVLCAGVPGTGKTLTAQVYSEVMSRPLYSVQCSQLGITAEDLEKQLLLVFERAQRWNAVLLLDEADVYIRARGDDLEQNAIVGVFLRVLEYYQSILFLTTNRAELIDDAIASRCIVKITYEAPTPEDQAEIWRILAQSAGIELKHDVIKEIVQQNPGITGRDVKNLLSLAQMKSSAGQTSISADTIKFAKRFKPTAGK